jgi:hypothetical protein
MWQVRGLLTLGQGRVEAGLQRSAAAASRPKGGRADGLILRVCQAFRFLRKRIASRSSSHTESLWHSGT